MALGFVYDLHHGVNLRGLISWTLRRTEARSGPRYRHCTIRDEVGSTLPEQSTPSPSLERDSVTFYSRQHSVSKTNRAQPVTGTDASRREGTTLPRAPKFWPTLSKPKATFALEPGGWQTRFTGIRLRKYSSRATALPRSNMIAFKFYCRPS